jgi:hypothetical protein
MDRQVKITTYERVIKETKPILQGETDLLAAMVTVVCLLHQAFDSGLAFTGGWDRTSC